ncbi:MAG: hypothetical protein ACE5LX_01290, partial [Nitrospinota bacterium]
PATEPSFEQALEAESAKLDGAKAAGEPQALSPPPSPSYLSATEPIAPSAFEQAGNLLDSLSRYQAYLLEPSISPAEMEPLVGELEEARDSLVEILKGLPEGSEVRSLLEEAAVISTVEAMKFRRGDYIS